MISLLPAILFGLYNVIYMVYIDPNFAEAYYQGVIAQMHIDYSRAELLAQLVEMDTNKEMFMSPAFNFFLMTVTVILI
jgi:hypothetical protein